MRYATPEEKEFIKKLGTFNENHKFDRKDLLRKYLKAAEKRVKWGLIDKEKAIIYAKRILQQVLLAEGDNGGFGMYV